MPAAAQRSRSPSTVLAVMATIGVLWRPASRRRISAAVSYPSIPGIWQSIKIRSKGCCNRTSRAASPLEATSGAYPNVRKRARRHYLIHGIVFDDQYAPARLGGRDRTLRRRGRGHGSRLQMLGAIRRRGRDR